MKRIDKQMLITQLAFGKTVRQTAQSIGLLPGQPKVLEYVLHHENCTQADICEAWDMDKSTLSGIIARMERDELILTRRDDQDKRRTYLSITEKGRKLWEPMGKFMRELNEKALEGFSDEEYEMLLSMLCRLRDNINRENQAK